MPFGLLVHTQYAYLQIFIINLTLNQYISVFDRQCIKGKRKDRVEPCWRMHIVCCVTRGGGCRAAALPGAPAGSARHEAAEGSQTQRGSPTTEGQRALQRPLQAVPGSKYTPLFRPSKPSCRPRGLAGEGPQHKSSRTQWHSISTTHWNWVPWGMGQEALAFLSPWAPVC